MGGAYFHYISAPAFIISWMMHMFLGMLWYSPSLFGDAFINLAHNGKQPRPDPRAMVAAAVGTATAMPIFCFLLAVTDCRSAGEGALWGFGLGFFFDSGINAAHGFFEDRPFALYVLHRGYHIVSLTLIGAVLALLCADHSL